MVLWPGNSHPSKFSDQFFLLEPKDNSPKWIGSYHHHHTWFCRTQEHTEAPPTQNLRMVYYHPECSSNIQTSEIQSHCNRGCAFVRQTLSRRVPKRSLYRTLKAQSLLQTRDHHGRCCRFPFFPSKKIKRWRFYSRPISGPSTTTNMVPPKQQQPSSDSTSTHEMWRQRAPDE